MEELEKKLEEIRKSTDDLKKIIDMLIIQKDIIEKINSISDTDRIDKEVM